MRLTVLLRFKQTQLKLALNKNYIPKHDPIKVEDLEKLEKFLENKPNILVLTGAGISTESGIPDYRSEGVGLYARSNHKPIQHPDFVKNESVRQRYWARNYVAWPRFSRFEPNSTHIALARLEKEGRISGIVTQNVDTLHSKAGSKNVIELHGNGYKVICLGIGCDYSISRHEFQYILCTLNPAMTDTTDTMRPDGDVDLSMEQEKGFKVPSCPNCGGNLKPHIVFFGDNIPQSRIMEQTKKVCESDGLLVLGSSLVVFSGYRLVLQTEDCELPVAIVNIGPTRADSKAIIKISGKCGDIIPKLFR